MNYKRKTLALLVALPISIGGCNPKASLGKLPLVGKLFNNTPEVKNVNLTVWGLWNSEATLRPLFQKYSEAHPNITISYEDRSIMPLVDYKERVFTRAFDGTKPDVVMAHVSWVPRLITGDGVHSAPAGLFSTEYLESSFYPVVREVGVVGNNLYSLPATYDGLILVYNKTHFQEAGITSPPGDWEEFRRDAITLTKPDLTTADATDLLRAGAAMGLADNVDHFSDILGLMFLQADVEIPAKLDTEQAADALTFYTNFYKEDRVWNSTMQESVLAFASGKVSMIMIPSWRLYELLDSMGDPSVIGVGQVPQARQETPITWATYWTWIAPKSTTSPQESWELIKYLVDEQQQSALFNEESKSRQFGSVFSNVNLSLSLTSNPLLKPVVESALYSHTAEISARSGNRRQVDALKQAVNEVLAGTPSPEALTTAKTTINK